MSFVNLIDLYLNGKLLEQTSTLFSKHLTSKYPDTQGPDHIIRAEKSFLRNDGQEPLEFIYIFKNRGDPEHGIPRHWHYIGSGLIDIQGYTWYRFKNNYFCETVPEYAEKVRPLPELYPLRGPSQSEPSFERSLNGFGFELTFRLKCDSDDDWDQAPPAWPTEMMQKLAHYVFVSKNILHVGDHIVMHEPLDKTDDSMDTSKIRHILFTQDPQLQEEDVKPMGLINFLQIVGVCEEELQAAREWRAEGILEMMKKREETGGPFLVTDMRRGETLFELTPEFEDEVRKGMEQTGSNMVQVCAEHKCSSREQDWYQGVEDSMGYPLRVADEFEFNEDDDSKMDIPTRPSSRMSQGSESALRIDNAELMHTRYYDRIYILLSYESAKSLPVMLHGRLRHGMEFSFQSYKGDSLVTFLPEGSPKKALVGPDIRFARKAHWLQIYVSNELRDQMIETIGQDFDSRNSMDQLNLPKNYSWPEFKLYLTVVPDI